MAEVPLFDWGPVLERAGKEAAANAAAVFEAGRFILSNQVSALEAELGVSFGGRVVGTAVPVPRAFVQHLAYFQEHRQHYLGRKPGYPLEHGRIAQRAS